MSTETDNKPKRTPSMEECLAASIPGHPVRCKWEAELATPRRRKVSGRSALRVQPEQTTNPQREF